MPFLCQLWGTIRTVYVLCSRSQGTSSASAQVLASSCVFVKTCFSLPAALVQCWMLDTVVILHGFLSSRGFHSYIWGHLAWSFFCSPPEVKLGSVSVAAMAKNSVEKEACRAPARNYWRVKGWFLSSCAHISWHIKCPPCAKVQEQKNKLVGTGPSLSFFQNFPRILSLILTKIIWWCVLRIPPWSLGKMVPKFA